MSDKIYYQCQRCTACCRWPGFVRLDDEEISRIAAFLEISEFDFIQTYTAVTPSRSALGLIEKENHECIFLEGQDCRIQPVKPKQCRDFPNHWNFPGWRDLCKAVPITPRSPEGSAPVAGTDRETSSQR